MATILANCRIISFLSDRLRFAIFDHVQSLFEYLRFTDSSVRQTYNDMVILFTPCPAISCKPVVWCTTVCLVNWLFDTDNARMTLYLIDRNMRELKMQLDFEGRTENRSKQSNIFSFFNSLLDIYRNRAITHSSINTESTTENDPQSHALRKQ
jgi:hypothetical protein